MTVHLKQIYSSNNNGIFNSMSTLSHCVMEILRHIFKKEQYLSWAGHKESDIEGFFF